MTMADKIVVMQAGEIEQIGAPLDLYDRPVNLFVASFIGSPAMNQLAARIVDGGADGGAVEVAGTRLPCAAAKGLAPGRKVTFGIRPEHFTLTDHGLRAKISVIEPTGSETHVLAQFGAQELVAVFRERHDFRPGDQIFLSPDPQRAHVFDTDSGARL